LTAWHGAGISAVQLNDDRQRLILARWHPHGSALIRIELGPALLVAVPERLAQQIRDLSHAASLSGRHQSILADRCRTAKRMARNHDGVVGPARVRITGESVRGLARCRYSRDCARNRQVAHTVEKG